MVRLLACLAAFAPAAVATAQSFNIDFSPSGEGPPEGYAGAADQPGHWISIPGTQSTTYFNLVDVDGVVTGVSMSQFGGTETVAFVDEDVTGDDATLMNDCLVTHTAIENCLFFNDMIPGEYELTVYARMPAQPDVQSVTNCDEEIGNPHYLVGGEWTGEHEEFVSYARHFGIVDADGPTAGLLRAHSGVPAGGDFGIGAALNGIQIRRIVAVTGDVNGDGVANVLDLLALLTQWGPCFPSCAADLNGDNQVNVVDLVILLSNWT